MQEFLQKLDLYADVILFAMFAITLLLMVYKKEQS